MSARRLVLLASLAASAGHGCSTDPVRDAEIEALGPETPGGPGPDHRRGQPCLLCHDGAGAAKTKLAVAGTIYATPSPDARGAKDIAVQFVDATGGGPISEPVTSPASGNFFLPVSSWPDLTFPFRVRLVRAGTGEVVAVMRTTANRTGDCNFCHHPNPSEPITDEDRELARRSYGQIYVTQEETR